MDLLTEIRAKINDYPGYATESDIARSDELVRAYVGERLAELQERLGAEDADVAKCLEPLIRRAAFANQRVIARLEQPKLHPLAETALLDADLTLLKAADAAASVERDRLPEYAARMSAAFDTRDAALMQLRTPT